MNHCDLSYQIGHTDERIFKINIFIFLTFYGNNDKENIYILSLSMILYECFIIFFLNYYYKVHYMKINFASTIDIYTHACFIIKYLITFIIHHKKACN